MRTTIDIDDQLLREARSDSETSIQLLVEKALHLLVQIHRQEAVRDLRGSVQWEGDLDSMREGQALHPDSSHNAANAA